MHKSDGTIRVCFVAPKAYPLFNPDVKAVFGGAEVDTYMIATELAKDDRYAVSFVVADYDQPDEERRENVRIIKSVNFARNPLAGARTIWKALKAADADIYMMKTASAGVPLVARFCRKYGRRFVYRTAHRDECSGAYVKRHPVLGRLFIRSLQQAGRVFVQTQDDAALLRTRYDIDAVMVPNAHRLSEPGELPRELILWVGRSADFKRPERFLSLARALPQERFVMICQQATGDTAYAALKMKAARIANLEFIERVPFDAVDSYFERAKVFVNTSDAEGFANTFIQACKAGTAILSHTVNPDGFLDKYACGICCGSDGRRVNDELRTLLAEDCWRQYGDNGRAYVRQTHDISTVIERYKPHFEQLAGKGTIRVLHIIAGLGLGGAQVCLKQLIEHATDPQIVQYVYPLRAEPVDIAIEGNVLRHSYFRYDIRKFFAIFRYCRQYNIDIIHAHLHKPIMGALLATFFYNAKVIAHEHGSIARPGLQYSFYRLMLRLLKKRAALFVAVSQAAAKQLTQYAGIESEQIQVIYNAVDLKQFTPDPSLRRTVREELGIGPDTKVVGFMGRLSYVKGPDILLDAFRLFIKKHPDAILVYIGDGDMHDTLRFRAIASGLEQHVKFSGFQDNPARTMNALDIGVIPSRQEAFGIAALEFMSMKIPLVSCTIYGLAEIIKPGKNALVPKENTPDAICAALEQMITDEKRQHSLVENAFVFVRQFDVPCLVTHFHTIYQQVTEKEIDKTPIHRYNLYLI